MINLNRLKKEEILWLFNHYCRHGHRYIEHLACFEKENPPSPIKEKIGFIDIECCVTPGHKILTGDLRWISVENIKEGDEILGFDDDDKLDGVHGRQRKYRIGKVIRKKIRQAPVYKIILENGEVLMATGNHKWLGGQKYYRYWIKTRNLNKWAFRNQNSVFHRIIPVWDLEKELQKNGYEWGQLSAFIDGEGSISQYHNGCKSSPDRHAFRITLTQTDGVVLERMKKILDKLQINYTIIEKKIVGDLSINNKKVKKYKNCYYINIGHLKDVFKILGVARPAKLKTQFKKDHLPSIRTLERIRVVKVEYAGIQDIVSLQTDIGTYIINGFPCHNSNFQADFGVVLTYCIKEENGKIYCGKITPQEIRNGTYDKNLLTKCVKDMKRFDRLVYYWGGDYRFDIPFLRSRALLYGLDFPLYKEIKGLDLYTYIKKKFRFHRNRLETACEFFGIPAKQHPIKFDVWIKALGGNQKALNYILTHNKEDVVSLEKLYHKVLPYINTPNSSI